MKVNFFLTESELQDMPNVSTSVTVEEIKPLDIDIFKEEGIELDFERHKYSVTLEHATVSDIVKVARAFPCKPIG